MWSLSELVDTCWLGEWAMVCGVHSEMEFASVGLVCGHLHMEHMALT